MGLFMGLNLVKGCDNYLVDFKGRPSILVQPMPLLAQPMLLPLFVLLSFFHALQ